MARKKLKLEPAKDSLGCLKNFSRRFPCLLKKGFEISAKTGTKALILVQDTENRTEAVYCSEYLDTFFASLEKYSSRSVKIEGRIQDEETLAFTETETPAASFWDSPISFRRFFIPVARSISKAAFKRNIISEEEMDEAFTALDEREVLKVQGRHFSQSQNSDYNNSRELKREKGPFILQENYCEGRRLEQMNSFLKDQKDYRQAWEKFYKKDYRRQEGEHFTETGQSEEFVSNIPPCPGQGKGYLYFPAEIKNSREEKLFNEGRHDNGDLFLSDGGRQVGEGNASRKSCQQGQTNPFPYSAKEDCSKALGISETHRHQFKNEVGLAFGNEEPVLPDDSRKTPEPLENKTEIKQGQRKESAPFLRDFFSPFRNEGTIMDGPNRVFPNRLAKERERSELKKDFALFENSLFYELQKRPSQRSLEESLDTDENKEAICSGVDNKPFLIESIDEFTYYSKNNKNS